MSSFGKRQSFGITPLPPVWPAAAAPAAIEVPPKFPFFTAAVALALCAIYAAQFYLTNHSATAFTFRDAVTWGGIDRYLVIEKHEWWRIFTAPWLHASIYHLTGNLITLVVAGTVLERHIGSWWLAAVYVTGALAGSIASIIMNDPRMVSEGASAAIIALVVLVYALSYHVCLQAHAKRLRRIALFVLLPALVPSAAHGAVQIDIGAHCGGFLAGLAAAFLLLIIWDESEPMPGGQTFAAAAAAFGLGLATIAGMQTLSAAQIYLEQARALVPESIIKDSNALARDGAALSVRYPHDPMLRLNLSVQALQGRRYAEAEYQAKLGLQERALLSEFFPQGIEYRLQAMLAIALLGQQQFTDALEAAAPACRDPAMRRGLAKLKLCKGVPNAKNQAISR
jgi:membrane associated rhomboid family serine protease